MRFAAAKSVAICSLWKRFQSPREVSIDCRTVPYQKSYHFHRKMEQPLKEEKSKSESCDQPSSSAPDTGSSEFPRGSANRKERKRTLTMNTAFAELRDHIPNVPPDTKLSKIKTLRLAISYIKFLMEILEESNEGKTSRSHRNFVADLSFQNEGREKRKRENNVSKIIFVW